MNSPDPSTQAPQAEGHGPGGASAPVRWTTLAALGLVMIGLVWLTLVVVEGVSPRLVVRPEIVDAAQALGTSDNAYQDQHELQIGVYALLEEYVNWFIQKDYLSFVFNIGSAMLLFACGVFVYLQSLLSPSADGENALSVTWGQQGKLELHTRSLGIFSIFTSACVLLVVNLSNEPNVEGFRSLVERLETPVDMAKAYQDMLEIRPTAVERVSTEQSAALRAREGAAPGVTAGLPAAQATRVDAAPGTSSYGNARRDVVPAAKGGDR